MYDVEILFTCEARKMYIRTPLFSSALTSIAYLSYPVDLLSNHYRKLIISFVSRLPLLFILTSWRHRSRAPCMRVCQ